MAARSNARDAAEVTDRVAGVLHNRIDRVSEQAAGLERSMRTTARVGAKKARAARGDLERDTRRTLGELTRFVKHRPVMGTAIVAALGLVALSVLRR